MAGGPGGAGPGEQNMFLQIYHPVQKRKFLSRRTWRGWLPRRHDHGGPIGKCRGAFGGGAAGASVCGAVLAEVCEIARAVPAAGGLEGTGICDTPAHVAGHRTVARRDQGDAFLERRGVRVPAFGVCLAVAVPGEPPSLPKCPSFYGLNL